MPTFHHALDPTGINPNNLVSGEIAHGIGSPNRLIKPEYGPYFVESMVVVDTVSNQILVKGDDYDCVGLVQEASIKFQKPIAEFVKLKKSTISSDTRLQYQSLGGLYENSTSVLANLWNSYINDNRLVDFNDGITDKPFEYPAALHPTLFKDITNFEPLISAIERLTQAVTISNVPAYQNLVDWFKLNLAMIVPELVSIDDLTSMTPSNKLITIAALIYVLDRYTIPTDRITGTLPVSQGGTSATTAASAFNNLKQHASTTDTGVIAIADSADTTSTDKAVTPAILNAGLIKYEPLLGYTPVQQGGGDDQTSSKVFIGWRTDGSLGLRVDITNFGNTWPINVTGNASASRYADSGYFTVSKNGRPVLELHKQGFVAGAWYINDDNNLAFGRTNGDGNVVAELFTINIWSGDTTVGRDVVVGRNLHVAEKIISGTKPGVTGGFGFSGDPDSGMFSPGDGILDHYVNNQLVSRMHQDKIAFYKPLDNPFLLNTPDRNSNNNDVATTAHAHNVAYDKIVGHNAASDAHGDIRSAIATKQDNLGYTPVQQGGGTYQSTNKLYLGWRTDNTLGLQVDSTNFGNTWPINITGTATPSAHSHSGYAATSHSHSEYAASTHTHSGYQAALGFTPVQQGGGDDQTSSKVFIGWRTDGSLGLRVDSTNFGPKWPINISGESVKEGTVRHIAGNLVGYKLVSYDNGTNIWNLANPVSATRPAYYSTATAEQSRQNGQAREVFFADIERASGRLAIIDFILNMMQNAGDFDRAVCVYLIPKNSSGYDFSVTPIAVWRRQYVADWLKPFTLMNSIYSWMPVSDTGIVAIGIYFNYLTHPDEYVAGDYSVMIDGLVKTTIINNGM